MGVCNSTTNKGLIIEKNENYDFHLFKNEINEKKEIQKKGFLIKARLWEIHPGKKIRKCLFAKFFFIEPNGSFISKVKPLTGEIINYTGQLEENGAITLKSEQVINKVKKIKTYE